jgi:E3 ubiquitin-protein ligase DOA10
VYQKKEEKDHVSITSKSNPNCRICWDDDFNVENPLLQICKCRGGVEFIHF